MLAGKKRTEGSSQGRIEPCAWVDPSPLYAKEIGFMIIRIYIKLRRHILYVKAIGFFDCRFQTV
jgi:hypothetical protein